MKQCYYPLTLELHVKNKRRERFVHSFYLTNRSNLEKKIENLNTMYNLKEVDYQMYLIVKSKERIKKKRGSSRNNSL